MGEGGEGGLPHSPFLGPPKKRWRYLSVIILNEPCAVGEGGGAPFLPEGQSLPVHPGEPNTGKGKASDFIVSLYFLLRVHSVLGTDSNANNRQALL